MKPIRDARSERRLAVELNAKISIEGRVIVARTRDISRSGMCLVSDTEVQRDTELGVELVLSLGPSTVSEPLTLVGRTAWCTALFGKFQIGVKFVGVEGERRRFLDLFLRFLNGEIKPAGSIDFDPEPEEPMEDKDDPFRP